MGKVTLPAGGNPGALNNHVGQHGGGYYYDNLEIEIPNFSQATMDAALITYAADVTNINNTFAQLVTDEETQRVKNTFDDEERRLLRAFAELVMDELNTLRALHSLAPRTFAQLRTAIKNKVT